MGAVGAIINVAGDGDREALHDAIWQEVQQWVRMYTADSANKAVLAYVYDAVSSGMEEGHWGVMGDTLAWMFMDFAGCCSRSANVWAHWTNLALASEWERIVELAEEHDLRVVSERTALDALLVDRRGFVSIRKDLWLADRDALSGDDKTLALAKLSADERAAYDAARVRCMCGPCTMLRPDLDIETAMLRGLANATTAEPCAWYIARMNRTSPHLLTALVRAAGSSMLQEPLERYASREPAAWDTLLAAMPALVGVARGRAFYALAATKLDDARRVRLVREIKAALTKADAGAIAAAEVAGYVGRGVPELDEQLAAILDRDVIEDLRHNVVLGLVNLHVPKRSPSVTVRERLQREAKRSTEAGRLANWFVEAFAG